MTLQACACRRRRGSRADNFGEDHGDQSADAASLVRNPPSIYDFPPSLNTHQYHAVRIRPGVIVLAVGGRDVNEKYFDVVRVDHALVEWGELEVDKGVPAHKQHKLSLKG